MKKIKEMYSIYSMLELIFFIAFIYTATRHADFQSNNCCSNNTKEF